jgi:transposase
MGRRLRSRAPDSGHYGVASDGGAEHWAIIASLIETCKLNDVDPLAYLTDVLTRIVNGHPNSDIDQLFPWAYCRQNLKAVA